MVSNVAIPATFLFNQGLHIIRRIDLLEKKIRSLELDHNFRTLRIIEKRNLTKFFCSLFFKIKWGIS